MGISPSRLTGWEPAEVTTFEWDDSGRLRRAITVREAEFSEADVALLLADYERAHVRRGRHGLRMADAVDPANQFAFEVAPPVTDWAQKKLNEAQEAFKKRYPQADMDALLWTVAPRADDKPA